MHFMLNTISGIGAKNYNNIKYYVMYGICAAYHIYYIFKCEEIIIPYNSEFRRTTNCIPVVGIQQQQFKICLEDKSQFARTVDVES